MVRFFAILLACTTLLIHADAHAASKKPVKGLNGVYSGLFQTVFSSCGEPGAFTSTVTLRALTNNRVRATFSSGISAVGKVVGKRGAKINFVQFSNGLQVNSTLSVTGVNALGGRFVMLDRVTPLGQKNNLLCSEQHVAPFLQKL